MSNKFIKEKIIIVKYLSDYKLYIEFDDGLSGTIDFEPYIQNGVFRYLLIKDNFARCHPAPSFGGLEWDNDLDMAPEFIRDLIEEGKNQL